MIILAVRTLDRRIHVLDRVRGVNLYFSAEDNAATLQEVHSRLGPGAILVGFPPDPPVKYALVPGEVTIP
jgi:hypothetical protein